MALIAGTGQLVGSGVLYTDQRNFYAAPNEVARLHPSSTPFLTRLMSLPVDRSPDVEYKMFQKEAYWRKQYFQVNNGSGEAWASAGAPGDTNGLTVDGPIGMVLDASALNRVVEIWDSTWTTKRGIAVITTVASTTSVTITALGNPSSATEATANLVDNDYLLVIGSIHGEISESPASFTTEPEVVWNSKFHHRTPLTVSNDLHNARLRGVEGMSSAQVSKLSEDQTDKFDEHKTQLDQYLWRGYRVGGTGGVAYGAASGGGTTDTFAVTHTADSTNGKIRSTMGWITGVERYGKRLDTESEQSYFERVRASLTPNQMIDDFAKIFQFEDDPANPGVREGFAGPTAYSGITKIFMGNSDVTISKQEMGTWGYHIKRIEFPDGVVELAKVPTWYNTPYDGHIAMPTMRFVRLRAMEGSDNDPGLMGYYPDIKKDNRPLLRKDEYHSHIGLDVRQIKSQTLYILK